METTQVAKISFCPDYSKGTGRKRGENLFTGPVERGSGYNDFIDFYILQNLYLGPFDLLGRLVIGSEFCTMDIFLGAYHVLALCPAGEVRAVPCVSLSAPVGPLSVLASRCARRSLVPSLSKEHLSKIKASAGTGRHVIQD